MILCCFLCVDHAGLDYLLALPLCFLVNYLVVSAESDCLLALPHGVVRKISVLGPFDVSGKWFLGEEKADGRVSYPDSSGYNSKTHGTVFEKRSHSGVYPGGFPTRQGESGR